MVELCSGAGAVAKHGSIQWMRTSIQIFSNYGDCFVGIVGSLTSGYRFQWQNILYKDRGSISFFYPPRRNHNHIKEVKMNWKGQKKKGQGQLNDYLGECTRLGHMSCGHSTGMCSDSARPCHHVATCAHDKARQPERTPRMETTQGWHTASKLQQLGGAASQGWRPAREQRRGLI
jgi:hypothetical protein